MPTVIGARWSWVVRVTANRNSAQANSNENSPAVIGRIAMSG